jgi:hypothetical protein
MVVYVDWVKHFQNVLVVDDVSGQSW